MAPQTLGTPLPPQVALPVHTPQLITWPQPSAMAPQLAPAELQVRGVQFWWPHAPGMPPPPQVSMPVQAPH